MARAVLISIVLVLLSACAARGPHAVVAGNAICAETARHAPLDPRIGRAIAEARRQHLLFGGQTISSDGGLFRIGYDEAEWSRPPGESMSTWQRVATFWQALSEADPPDVMTSAGWVARSEAERAMASGGSEGSPADVALREALLRAAIVDTPWSATFISYLMKTAGFAPAEFRFSDSHVDYVQAAFATSAAEAAGQPAPHVFRACDLATTPPRAGDLLCATRASTAGIVTFDALGAAMAARAQGEAFPMHCDLVVRADPGADAGIETIGGNVVNSVTLSRMTLDANHVLSDAYLARDAQALHCARGDPPCRGHLSRRPWLVLLQFRQ
jgi:hypothetical protein